MNLARQKDTRLTHRTKLFFILIMKYYKKNVKTNKNHIKKLKIPRNKHDQGGERFIKH